ncbi:MAG: alpha-amylase family glycosyl hydrolase [Lachnospiraceae bacterium]|nr:alpha-amylase family glycosyl hydrolase [Lachnospiraceae bacterium]
MTETLNILKGNPYPLGVTINEDGSINFAAEFTEVKNDCGIVLYENATGKESRISFPKESRIGNLFCLRIEGMNWKQYTYNYYNGDIVFQDPYAKKIVGNEKWGKTPKELRCGFYDNNFEWGEDAFPETEYEKSLLYLLHVRGFTKHSSAQVEKHGTFEGLTEKIPYLSSLGITAIELMPSYEFLELEPPVMQEKIPIAYQKTEPSLNYWGYKEAFYFSPKSSYCAKPEDNINSFKRMVKELHRNHMELIMQFYFPNSMKQSYILEVLRFWVYEYHIDGIHLMGERIPTALLGRDPVLAHTKLLCTDFPLWDIYPDQARPNYKNLATYKDDYMYDMRRFLKSDERMLETTLHHMKSVSEVLGQVHYMTNYNGFTLADLVSYDRKHNEENGENNRDGNPYNCSWNCGEEGKTRKKSILDLRLKQMKNAFVLNILSQGTPMILAGDEFANSQKGNNNPYCIDSPVTWLNWNDQNKNRELFEFVKCLIAFRKSHPVFTKNMECSMLDTLSCGYPDLSYHSEDAWRIHYDDLTRHFAMMYCEDYAKSFVYLAVNMHWVPHKFALPKLPPKMKWKSYLDTASHEINEKAILLKNQSELVVKERSIQVLVGE